MIDAGALASSPRYFPLRLSGTATAELIDLGEADYRAASFLDERLLASHRPAGAVDLAPLEAANVASGRPFHLIFHIGHVGSTLLSRLLDASPRVFGLREPAVLRQCATSEIADPTLDALMALLARTWWAEQTATIKATSFVSEIGPRLMAGREETRAILMAVREETLLAGLLGGPATRAELPTAAPPRLARLVRRLGAETPPVSSDGERAAAVFAAEMLALDHLAQTLPQRVQWLDFDAFLLDPRESLMHVMGFLFGGASNRELAAILASPDMGRYSKAPEHPFGPGVRGALLRESAQENRAEIAAGRRWLERLVATHPAAGAGLARAGAALGAA